MARNLSSDLLDRLRLRVADPVGRIDAPDTSPHTSYLGGVFETSRVEIGTGAPPPGQPPLPPPATDDDVASARQALGFNLPPDLEQLYRQVANGGFGPSGGLGSLESIAEHYRSLTDHPPHERGAEWPAHMLPVGLTAPGADCYDIRSGRIAYWDGEPPADPPDGQGWDDSFRTEADSLEAWLEAWLAKPPFAEQQKEQIEAALLDNMRTTLAHWRAMSPEERAEYGLSEEGWEEELFGHLGIDLTDL